MRSEVDEGPIEVGAAERRRGIELVLDRQPEIDLDELQRLLGRVGIEVDTGTLVDDLDALGYEVDEDPPDPVAPTVDGPPPTLEPAARSIEDGGSRSWPMLAVAALVVVAVVAVFVLGGDGDAELTDASAATAETVTVRGGTTPASTEATEPEPVEVAPAGPGSDPALEEAGTRTDDFERSDVGDFPDVGPWEVLAGEWANTDGNLDVTARPDGGAAVIGVDVGTGDVRAQVQIDRRASRSGLAFRIVDGENFFVWAYVPEFATNLLFEVVDGTPRAVANSGLTPTGDGLPALGINIVGDQVELLNDGVVVATYDGLPAAEGATRIGAAALSGVADLPLFDEYRVRTP